MGLLKHVLFWPLTGPTFLAEFAMRKVHGVVREELTDDQAIKEELLALQMELELGDMDDSEYREREAALMQRLREVREWREEFGLGTPGGPVQVAREDAETAARRATDQAMTDHEVPGEAASPEGASVELTWDESER